MAKHIRLFDADLNEYQLRTKLERAFRKSYAIHLAVFIGRDNQEIEQIRKILKNIANEKEFRNIIFLVIESILDASTFDKFLDYNARAVVANKHNYIDERNINEDNARKVLDGWIRTVKSGYLEWYLRDETDKSLVNNFGGRINRELSQKIFLYGFENLDECQKRGTVWQPENSKVAIEILLFYDNRASVETQTRNQPWIHLRGILKDNNEDYVVDTNLNFKRDINEDHPLKKMDIEIRKAINNRKDAGIFDLAEAISFLNEPPYGLYPNKVNMAAMGFLMRKYVGEVYEKGTGKPIEKEMMRDKILNFFKYHDKIEVHFGTEEEKEFIRILAELFNLKDVGSLTDVRWKIRQWVKESSYPLWVFKLSEKSNDNTNKAIDNIFQLIQSVDRDITYDDVKSYLDSVKDVKYDLNLVIKKENIESLFKEWLKQIEIVNISNMEINEVIEYTKTNMQEEVASWSEDKVLLKVNNWRIEKDKEREKKGKEEEEKEEENEGGGVSPPDNGGVINPKRVEEMVSRIEKWDGDKAKKMLIRLIKDKNEIVDYIEKYEGA